ncbi:MAG: thiamine pyrophosphate-dependent enzyme [Pseudomonadota bacterium]
MSLERVRLLIERFRAGLQSARDGSGNVLWRHDPALGLELLESMLLVRHLDRAAHELRASGHGHYTICSAGHEASVVLGRLTRPGDPSLIHYRDGAFFIERARQVPELDAVRAVALSLVASAEDPASGGRHKVFGSAPLGIVPQTSTIASHLPRAVGLAFALERKERLGLSPPTDAIVVAVVGDAGMNHSTALGALNATSWAVHQSQKMPILFVCEDNGLGISVRTPPGWIETRTQALPHVRRFFARSMDLSEAYGVAEEAVRYCRTTRRPALLHLECVRLLGHAGSDVDSAYRPPAEIEAALAADPVLAHARALLASGCATATELLALDRRAAERVDAEAERAKASPRLADRRAVLAAILPNRREHEPAARASASAPHGAPQNEAPLTLAQGIQRALGEILERHPSALVFGEDVAKKGGVYGVTKGLYDRFGPLRVFNTLLDEQTVLGLALGAAQLGLLPIPEIQYLAYLHNAEDQLRGEAATLPFFSAGAYDNPMIVRIAGLSYQKGFGGHFHNDNSLAVLRDIPGLVVAIPARADDALALYRSAVRLALGDGRVVVVVEPIALYHRRDLYAEGDGRYLARDTGEVAELGRARVYPEPGADVLLVTYGNGVGMSLRAREELRRIHGVRASVLDLRFVVPLPEADIVAQAREARAVLVVDECRRSGSPSEAVIASLVDAGYDRPMARVTSADSFIPLGEAAEHVLLGIDEIVNAARTLVARAPARTRAPS